MGEAEIGQREVLSSRVAADPHLSPRCKDLLVAAFDSAERLAAVLRGEVSAPTAAVSESSRPSGPTGIYLGAVRVRSFRGIGPRACLDLRPGPGLTVVTGRNGSGKSSFAEAAELALTGRNVRWDSKQTNKAVWREGWRNLHGKDPTEIEVDLVMAGEPVPTVRMSWTDRARFDDRTWARERCGAQREPLDGAGWPADQTLYRPFLAYSELGALLDGSPVELHEALHRLLGLGDVEAARERLKSARTERDRRVKALREAKTDLLADLGARDDARARRVEQVLHSRTPDLAQLAELTLEDDHDGVEAARLRAVEALSVPDADEVSNAAHRIRQAIDQTVAAGTAETSRAESVAGLLQSALAYHAAHGDGRCPVCRAGFLNHAWRGDAEAAIRRLRTTAAGISDATRILTAAVTAARELVAPVPAVLRTPPAGLDVSATLAAWQKWQKTGRIEKPTDLAHALVQRHTALAEALTVLHEAARAELTRLDNTWRPLAARLFAWHQQAQQVADEAGPLADVKKAETWLRAAAAGLRDERMVPFADAAQQIWQQLCQESSVHLGAVQLTGSASTRKVLLDVTVDGTDSAALSVMSQGELHALGLSLFLPRATVGTSPFRFVMIDDPVQAMDPAKVDGLARVLTATARTRQIIVFSHDDRLADAVRRLPDPVTIWKVSRREHSRVELRRSTDR